MRFNTELLCILAMFIGSTATAEAGRLHVIIAADTTDATTGKYSDTDGGNMRGAFASALPEYSYQISSIPPAQMTAQGIIAFIDRNVRPAADDSIVFYFSGHGGYNDEIGHFLALRNNSEGLKRSSLLETLQSRNPRFVALITESCFNFIDVVPPPMTAAAGMAPKVIPPLYRRLFFDIEGLVDLNGCSRGQKSLTYTMPEKGSIFTGALTGTLYNRKDSSNLGWSNFLHLVRNSTNENFQALYPQGVTVKTDSGRTKQRSQDPDFVSPLQIRELSAQSANNVRPRPPQRQPPQTPTPRPQPPSYPGSGNRVALGVRVKNCKDPGVHIMTVNPGSPATRMRDLSTNQAIRLEAGDHILSVNGVTTNDYLQMTQLVSSSGSDVTLIVMDLKTKKQRRLYVSLLESGGNGGNNGYTGNQHVARPSTDRLGVKCHNCKDGIHVDVVYSGRPGSRIRDGRGQMFRMIKDDHITSLNGQSVNTVEQLYSVMSRAPSQTTIGVRDAKTKAVARYSITLD